MTMREWVLFLRNRLIYQFHDSPESDWMLRLQADLEEGSDGV